MDLTAGGGGGGHTPEKAACPAPAPPGSAFPISAVEAVTFRADTDSQPVGRKCLVNSECNYRTSIQEQNIIRF